MQFPWSTLNNDPTVAGCVYPSHQTMGPHYDYDGPRSVYKLARDQLVDFEPDFNDVLFEPTAEHLDLIASAPIPHYGWVISNRFQDLLSQFLLPSHRLYRLPVIQNGKPLDGYSYIHLPQIPVPFTDSTSFRDAEAQLEAIDGVSELDVIPIYTPVRFGYFFISHRLRQAIEASELTGIRFGTSKLFRTRSPVTKW